MLFNKKEFLRFVIVGVVNTLHYYVLYMACLHILEFHYILSHTIGFLFSLIGSFLLNTMYTYKVKPTWSRFLRFPFTQAFNTIATAVLLFIFVDLFHISSSLAPIAAVFITVPMTFILTRRILKPS
ncbi:GtrA family protein [Cytobacillus depressus]|uniref:GtrA family protein n=1 Tax=Cytobacillus depressus TaxID=1602942 RepID=A0A6L3V447_9BACI|nr:GtrA family protein [Cytobacillus depressus]KAB2332145.1 GtrA family protein [Cytobacillus depressus]